MKWLFAILVALNIVVFGTIVAGKVVHMNQNAAQTRAEQAADTASGVAPAEPSISVDKPNAAAASDAKVNEKKPADEKDKTADAKEQNADNKDTASGSGSRCTATATLPEDDYHRLKGLLDRWPHNATEFVDTGAVKKNRRRPTRYMVVIPNAGSEVADVLRNKGFDFALNQGQASLGVFARRSDAEALMARAKLSGFSDVDITTIGGDDADNVPDTSAVSKMRVVFSPVNNQDMQDINRIVGRYGKLIRGNGCRS